MPNRDESVPTPEPARRAVLSAATLAMTAGLAGGYGGLAAIGVQFLYSARDDKRWFFVATLERLAQGESLVFVTPAGSRVVIARQRLEGTADDFIALSSVCPHLGCQVHWEPQNERFFCPCHNGAFDAKGEPTAGPPAVAGQRLTHFPLKVEGNLLFVEAPASNVVS